MIPAMLASAIDAYRLRFKPESEAVHHHLVSLASGAIAYLSAADASLVAVGAKASPRSRASNASITQWR